jgi:hypothetical protein
MEWGALDDDPVMQVAAASAAYCPTFHCLQQNIQFTSSQASLQVSTLAGSVLLQLPV